MRENGDLVKRERHREESYYGANLHSRQPRSSERRRRMVDMDHVRGAEYAAKMEKLVGKRSAKAVRDEAVKILERRNGLPCEDLSAIRLSDGSTISRVRDSKSPHKAVWSDSMKMKVGKERRRSVVTVHNHPDSMPPSSSDFISLLHPSVRYGIIACHDGSIIKIEVKDYATFQRSISDGRITELDGLFGDYGDAFSIDAVANEINLALMRRFGVGYEIV